MTISFAFQVIFAVLAVLFVSYGLLHEDKFVAFEDMIIKVIKKQIYLHKRRKALEKRRQQGSYPVRQSYETQKRRHDDSAQRRRVA